MKILKDKKLVLSEKFMTQLKQLVCDYKTRKVKDSRRMFVPGEDMEITWRQCKEGFQLIYQQVHRDRVIKKSVLKWGKRSTDRSCEWSKTHLNIQKHGSAVMLVMVLVRHVNYGGSGNRETLEISRSKEKG